MKIPHNSSNFHHKQPFKENISPVSTTVNNPSFSPDRYHNRMTVREVQERMGHNRKVIKLFYKNCITVNKRGKC